MATVGGKDFALDMFHAMGKVLYCKREDANSHSEPKLPRHLCHHTRLPLKTDLDELLGNLPVSPDFFVTFLHQNYLDFFTDISHVAEAAEGLSLADPFFDEWTVSLFKRMAFKQKKSILLSFLSNRQQEKFP